MNIKVLLSLIVIAAIFTLLLQYISIDGPAVQFIAYFLAALLAVFATKLFSPVSRHPIGSGSREQGEVKWFSPKKGFGFITRDSGEDIFVHFRSIEEDGHKILREGQRVEFEVAESDKGMQAENVVKLG